MNVLGGSDQVTLLDIADRLLDTGVVLDGEATISVADVDLIYLGLNVALTSVDKMRRVTSEEPAPPVRASREVIERSEAARHGAAKASRVERERRGPGAMSVSELEQEAAAVRSELDRVRADIPERVNVDPDEVERGLAKLVLTIVEFVRQLLERQAVRRMEHGSLTEDEVERVGLALERLDKKMTEMAARFGLAREELTMKLGPLGDLV
ncbi:MAG: gas vesicle protein GvpJ [Candidatus Limnocylindria bacterium]